MQFLPDPDLLLHPSILLVQLRPPILRPVQVPAGTTRSMEIELGTVGNPAQSGKLAVRQVELPFQPASFSELMSEPVPEPVPVVVRLRGFHLHVPWF